MSDFEFKFKKGEIVSMVNEVGTRTKVQVRYPMPGSAYEVITVDPHPISGVHYVCTVREENIERRSDALR